jgi:hypothetical protein
MDNTLRGWAKLDTAAGETAIQSNVIIKHQRHIGYLASIPIANVLIKGICTTKHPIHISYLANIPATNVLQSLIPPQEKLLFRAMLFGISVS